MSIRTRILPIVATAVAFLLVVAFSGPASAAQPQVGLGTSTPYAVLAGTTVTNTGPSVISGDVGVSPGTAVVGFPPGQVNAGTIHAADAVALSAKNDLTTAYNDAAGRGPVVDETSKDLGGQTLVPGVYNAASAMALTGTVTLDAGGDPDAIFVFQAGSTLITASSSTVALTGGAQACHVFWKVGSSATIGTATRFVGSVLALTDISLQTGATVQGRMLARNGQVSLDDNTISAPACDAPTASPSVTPTATPSSTPTSTPSTTPSSLPTSTATSGGGSGNGGTAGGSGNGGGSGSGGSGSGTGNGSGSGSGSGSGGGTPVPVGHPGTGRLPTLDSGTGWLALGVLCLGGAGGAVILGSRRPRTARHVRS